MTFFIWKESDIFHVLCVSSNISLLKSSIFTTKQITLTEIPCIHSIKRNYGRFDNCIKVNYVHA